MKKLTKHIKNLFERIKKNAKKNYYRDEIKLFENDIRNTWKIMKEVIGKKKCNNETLPKHLIVDKIEINDAKSTAEKFNEFFVNIGPNLANKIPQCDLTFKSYLPTINTTLNETMLSEDEFEEAFKLLKRNKSPGHDGLDVNIITSVYELIKKPLLKIFNESINLGIFPENMKIAKVTPIFKSGKKELLTNYRPISVLSCFSKILERIMYNRVYNYLNDNNLLFHKQFGFRKSHSTDHALIELINSTYDSFNQNKYTLGVFIDLSKAFNTVDHNILIDKLNLCVIKNNSLKWFSSYLSNRKQFIQAGAIKTSNLNIICGGPQGSILGPLLFVIYVNDLCNVSKIFEPIIFADDTNLFFSHKNIKELFHNANLELSKVFKWFNASRLSLNKDKTKYTLFHKAREKDNIPLKLPSLFMSDREIKRIT